MNKTLIGKENYLFLINDSANEIEKHCDPNYKGNKEYIDKYTLYNNILLIIYPDKSYVYRKYLPDEYRAIYRPVLDQYKKEINNKILDTYEVLKNEDDIFYKTDTHINLKGNYIVYNYFADNVKKILNIELPKVDMSNLKKKIVPSLEELGLGIGDLTWKINLGEQVLEDKTDNYYYDEGSLLVYCKTILSKDIPISLFKLNEKNTFDVYNTQNYGNIFNWNIVSTYVLHKINNDANNNLKVLIFYDSFLLVGIHLYVNLFKEIYFVKSIFSREYYNIIKPDFVFEFRVERFLF
jgi:hypothetical protein